MGLEGPSKTIIVEPATTPAVSPPPEREPAPQRTPAEPKPDREPVPA